MLLTPKDLASQWNMATVTIRKMAADGRLPGAYKMGRDWRFDPVKINRWFQTREQKPKVKLWRSSKEVKSTTFAFNGMGKKSDNRLEQILGLPH